MINASEVGSRVGIYALLGKSLTQYEGLLLNVLYRSTTEIRVEIYSQRNDTENNIFYCYKSGKIEAATGLSHSELIGFVDDILHQILVDQGVENYDVTSNPDVVPTTVDYLVNLS